MQTLLGQTIAFPERYAPEILQRISRPTATVERHGEDRWQLYELSWLNMQGIPQAACGELRISCHSPYIIESKSLKLYLHSLNQERFDTAEEVMKRIQQDLNAQLETTVALQLFSVEGRDDAPSLEAAWPGILLEQQSLMNVSPALVVKSNQIKHPETLYTHNFKSHCPVTGQPDWASIWVRYQGYAIEHASLFAYLMSFRDKKAFHETCVEQIYQDIWRQCQPESLIVAAFFTRRGGIDINPWRSSMPLSLTEQPRWRTWRQ